MDTEGLLRETCPPAGEEVIVPSTGGVRRGWGADRHAPAVVVGGVHPRGERLVHVLRAQPPGELGIRLHAAFEASGEAHQGVGAVGVPTGGEGLLMVNFPKK